MEGRERSGSGDARVEKKSQFMMRATSAPTIEDEGTLQALRMVADLKDATNAVEGRASDASTIPRHKSAVMPSRKPQEGKSKRAQLYFVRMTREGSTTPVELPDGVIRTTSLTTREAKLLWTERPRVILVVKKWRDEAARRAAVTLAAWLRDEMGVRVVMDCGLHEDEDVSKDLVAAREELTRRRESRGEEKRHESHTLAEDGFESIGRDCGGIRLVTLADPRGNPNRAVFDSWINRVDLIACLGGDGTVLHTSYLFTRSMPPIISIAFGSLGFMTPFSLSDGRRQIEIIFEGKLAKSTATGATPSTPTSITSDGGEEGGDGGGEGVVEKEARLEKGLGAARAAAAVEGSFAKDPLRRRVRRPVPLDVAIRTRLKVRVYRDGIVDEEIGERVVLNEILVERGPSPYLIKLEAYVDDEPLTIVQADGIIIGTPTGSTAYSLSAGGAILMPSVPAILFTPICPHSLSFRPVLFPDSSIIRLLVPKDARSGAQASFDGRDATRLNPGDAVEIQVSEYPMPLLSKWSTHKDWVHSITTKLHWNRRELQKGFDTEEEPEDDISPPALFDDDD